MLSVYAVETEEMQLLDAVNLNSLLLLGTSHGWGWFFFSELFFTVVPILLSYYCYDHIHSENDFIFLRIVQGDLFDWHKLTV